MKDKPVELLAPAGSMEAYRAAAAAGADAVYLGAKGFNARQHARNFELNDLKEVIEDARIRGIKLYFVLNTLAGESEIQKAVDFASFVYEEGIDGIIVQDLGLVRILRHMAPDLPIHASTQMTIHNTDGVKAIQAMGIDRVVLSRELNLDEIRNIIQSTGIEAEVFIHGALCISRSGQCLLSSFIGGRSGNRGRCAQPCRLPWKLDEIHAKGDYLLSPKDLMTLEILPELLDTGVCALKIEGRMKSPEYVAGVVSIYRKYLDMARENPKRYTVDREDIRNLRQIFNRGGFTRGYLKTQPPVRLMSVEHPKNWGLEAGTVLPYEGGVSPANPFQKEGKLIRIRFSSKVCMGDGLEIWDMNHQNPSAIISVMMRGNRHVKTAEPGDSLLVGNFKTNALAGSPVYKTYDKALMQSLSEDTRKNVPTVPLSGTFRLYEGRKPVLELSDKQGNRVCVEGEEEAQKAQDKPLLPGRILEQMEKTKDTPYFIENLVVDTDSKAYIPISAVNWMRRNALDALSEKRRTWLKRTPLPFSSISRETTPEKDLSAEKKISLFFYALPPEMEWESIMADRVYLPAACLDHPERIPFQTQGTACFVWAPVILHDQQIHRFIEKIKPFIHKLDGVLVGNPGILHRLRKEFPDLSIALDFQMNVFNAWTIDALKTYSPCSLMPSLELDMEGVRQLKAFGIPLEAYVYGEVPVMTLELCPGSYSSKCQRQCESCLSKEGFIQDRTGRRFLYVTDPMWQRTTLFNCSRLMLEDVGPLAGTDIRMLRLGVMHESEEEIKTLCRFYAHRWTGKDEGGPVEAEDLQRIKSSRLTRGHYYRGVE